MEQEFAREFNSRESILRRALYPDASKLLALDFLTRQISEHGFKNIISFGAGTCALESLLKDILPEDCKVIATDVDKFCITTAKKHFPKIIAERFDFIKDDIGEFRENLGIGLEVAVFSSSSYVMDDENFINLFKRLKEIGLKQIIDFQGGYLDWMGCLNILYQDLLLPLRRNEFLRRLFKKQPIDNYIGKFHGFARSRDELRMLYKKSGVRIVKELSLSPAYKYVAVCSC